MCDVCRNAIVRVIGAGVASLTMMGLGIGAVGRLLTVFARGNPRADRHR
jgi:tetrahydromethanopterin S-methyltransferase subunit C